MKQRSNVATMVEKGKEMQHGHYFARIQGDTGVFRFVIRDRAGLRPSIHGFGRSLDEAKSKITEILGALADLEAQRAA